MIGLTVGNHTILSRIGQGGMGAVYLAQHLVLGRHAAVKVLLPEYSNNRDLTARFFNEARATAQLKHRAFVEVFDSGTLPDGSAYLVMEHLRGEDLAAHIGRHGRLALAQGVSIARDVAEAVAFAHRHGIVHRDLKPDNVFLARENDEQSGAERISVKVLDFGIAKLSQASISSSARTNTGVLLGTPLYMSPEQCRGKGQVDHRSDIYSLGCIIHTMLAGGPPFMGDGFGEVISAHLYDEPPSLRSLGCQVPLALDALVLRMLAKSPEQRPPNLDAVIAELSRVLPPASAGDRTLTAPTPPPPAPKGSGASGLSGSAGGTRPLLSKAGLDTSTLGQSAVALDTAARVRRDARRRWRLIVATCALAGAAVGAAALALAPRHADEETARPRGEVADRQAPPAPSALPSAPARRAPPTPADPQDPEPAAPPAADDPAAAPTAAAPAAAAAVETVTLKIISTPPGASVIDRASGKSLGNTPLERSFPRSGGIIHAVVQRTGYRAKEVTLKLAHDASVNLTLDKDKRPEPRAKSRADEPRPDTKTAPQDDEESRKI